MKNPKKYLVCLIGIVRKGKGTQNHEIKTSLMCTKHCCGCVIFPNSKILQKKEEEEEDKSI